MKVSLPRLTNPLRCRGSRVCHSLPVPHGLGSAALEKTMAQVSRRQTNPDDRQILSSRPQPQSDP